MTSCSDFVVLSDDDGAPPLRRRGPNHDFAALLVAADSLDVRELSTDTAAELRRMGGSAEASDNGRLVLGAVHLRWQVADSSPAGPSLALVREVCSCRRTRSELTHWIDYEVVTAVWFDPPLVESSPELPSIGEMAQGMRICGTFDVWGPLARSIKSGHVTFAACVPLHETETKRLTGTPCHRPTFRVVRGLLADVLSQPRPLRLGAAQPPALRQVQLFMPPPLRIVSFIISTRHLRNLSAAKEAQSDTIMAAFDDAEIASLSVSPPSRRFLIKARARFDVVMMLMRRHALQVRARDIRSSPQWYYMADSSPASGFESFSIVENMVDGNESTYRMAPCTFLAVGQLGLKQKVFAFLWALWLEVGPSQALFRWKLSHIVGFTTDRGVEKGIADVCDVLPEFLATLSVECSLSKCSHLFPHALWIPGFHHLLDKCAEHVLSALDFWPDFLRRLKQAIKFLRIDAHRQRIARAVLALEVDLDASGLSSKPPSFANWRWDTMSVVQGWLEDNCVALREVASGALFSTSQDAVAGRECCNTLNDERWWCMFWIVQDIVMMIHHLRRWASGCECHEAERRRGVEVSCWMAGRRLPFAWEHVLEFLEACKQRFQDPLCDDRTFGLDLGVLEETRKLCLRHTYAFVKQSSSWLNCLPFSLSRCDDIDRLAEARAEYIAQPVGGRHRVSDAFFSDRGELKGYVDQSIRDRVLHPRVAARVRAIALIPLAEHRGEQPHSALHHQSLRSRRAGRIWHASTLRLGQNVHEFRNLVGEDLERFSMEWGRARRLLQYSERDDRSLPARISHT